MSIEDNDDDLDLILRELRRGDYEVSHGRAQTEAEMREALTSEASARDAWQAIICCDDGLPHLSATQVLEIAKEIAPHLPFLLVSGAMNIDNAIETVKAGADAHIPKDNLARLVPALQRELAEKGRIEQTASASETAPLQNNWGSLAAILSALQNAWIEMTLILIGITIAILFVLTTQWMTDIIAKLVKFDRDNLMMVVELNKAHAALEEDFAEHKSEYVAKFYDGMNKAEKLCQEMHRVRDAQSRLVTETMSCEQIQAFRNLAEQEMRARQEGKSSDQWQTYHETIFDKILSNTDQDDRNIDALIGEQSKQLESVSLGISAFTFLLFCSLAAARFYSNQNTQARKKEIEGRAAQLMEEVAKRERIEQTLTENNQTFRTFIHATPLAVISLSLERKVQLWNAAAERMFGWKQEEVIGKLMPPSLEGAREEVVHLRDFAKRDSHVEMEVTRHHKDGSPIDLSLSIAPLRNTQGRINGTILVLADITERKLADAQILKLNRDLEAYAREMKIANEQLKRESEERIEAGQVLYDVNRQLATSVEELQERTRQMQLLGEMSDALQACSLLREAYPIITHFLGQFFPANIGALYLHDPARKIVEIATVWGDVKEQYLETIFTSEDCWALRRGQIHRVTSEKDGLRCKHAQHTSSYVCIPMSAQGETLGILHVRESNPHSIFDEAGMRLAVTVSDQLSLALANLRLRDELRQQAIRDPISKLFNRRYMEETLIREVSRAERNSQPLSIIMIDIDHFKEFNDSFGHEAGDLVLQSLAKFLSTRVRGSDVACRYGGEEFTLILPSATLDLARKRAEQIREGIQSIQVKYGGQTLGPITLSLGVAVFPDHGVTGEAILQLADAALYRAKQTGRNRVVISSE